MTKFSINGCIVAVTAVMLFLAVGCISVLERSSSSAPNDVLPNVVSQSETTAKETTAAETLPQFLPETEPTSLQLPDIASIVDSVKPAVVAVVAEVIGRDYFGFPIPGFSSGSGVIIDSTGYIITNNHVVQNATDITVTLENGNQLDADIIGSDRLSDLAVIRIDGDSFPSVPLANASEIRVGDWVIAIGNALALPGGPTVTVGVVSALGRSFEVEPGFSLYDLIQTDTVINPGNSGGPLINLDGKIVGINTATLRNTEVEGIGFAVNVDTVIQVSRELILNGRVKWAFLGVGLADLDPQSAVQAGLSVREGVIVTGVLVDGPAWQAGLKESDIILALEDEHILTTRDLIKLLRLKYKVGDGVAMEVLRQGQRITLNVVLGERPPG